LRKHFHISFFILILPAFLISASSPPVAAQATPDEHEQHHPQQQMSPMPSPTAANTNSNSNTNSNANTSSGGMTGGMSNSGTPGGMGNMMGEMMKQMGAPPPKELYPSLMNLPPDLPPEKRDEIKKLADARVIEGNALVSSGFAKLAGANQRQDFAQMREASEEIRRGQILLESGVAAQRALAENKNPQDSAFMWFKREMNLAPAVEVANPHGFFGLSWFHYVTMLTLAAFSAAMIWMYFRKMRRASALVARLAGGSGNDIPLPAVSTPVSLPQISNAEPIPVNLEIAPSKSNSWSGTLLVAKIFDETPNVKTFRLTDPAGGKLPFNYLPGQFITVMVAPNGLPVKRSYTIASSPTKRDYCEITVKHEARGTVSHYLNTRVHEGELLQLTGPSGKFTFTGEEADSIVLVAGGVGVTPLMSVVRYLTDRSWKGDIFFFFACWSEENIIFREEIEYLEKRYPNLRVTIILEAPNGASKKGYLTGRITKEILSERVPEIPSRRVHICGPPPMIDAVKQMLDELAVPKENVHTEIFVGKLPAPRSVPLAPEDAGKTATATFARSRKTAVLTPDKTILEASEDVGVNIDYSCRVGTCGICKTKLLSGKVTMDVEESLTDEDKANNVILACQAKATEDVAVDA
jgi:glycine betaine catabolism B